MPCTYNVMLRGVHTTTVAMEKQKGKLHPRTSYEGPEREKRYGCILSLTLV
jgi:hypothetical protein